MDIAQIALDAPPPSVKRANVEKMPQIILASPYTPRQSGKKVPQTILASLYISFQKGASLKKLKCKTSSNLGADAAVGNVKTARNVDQKQKDHK